MFLDSRRCSVAWVWGDKAAEEKNFIEAMDGHHSLPTSMLELSNLLLRLVRP
jgi:hypothetical protein